MPSWPPEARGQAQALEAAHGCLLHFDWRTKTWECWSHGHTGCAGVQAGALQEPPKT